MGSRRRRGSALYITVVGVALIISMMGMLAMVTARLELRRTGQSQDAQHARGLAQSALEFGLANIDFDANWRMTFTNGVESSPLDWHSISSEAGTMTFKLVDESDGNLADDASDMVRLYGIGRVGDAEYVSSVLLEPPGTAGLSCLEASFHTTSLIDLTGVTWTTNQFISTNKSGNKMIKGGGSGILNGSAEAVGTIEDGFYTGTETEGITPRQMPDPTLVFEYYLNNGTWIDVDDLPNVSGYEMMESVVLSPGNNPYGSGETNPQGIYVIDCENNKIRVKLVRLLGTLVLLNPGSGSDLDNDQHWEPAVRNFPVLMVQGDITFNWQGDHTLRESMAGVNYNPAHTPYNDESDSDMTDEYPGLIKGLIYVTGNLDIQHECVMEGVVVTGSVNPIANLTLTYDPIFLSNPPPGFRAAATGAPNLLSNPDCESGTTNWYVEGSAAISSDGSPHSGAACIRVDTRMNYWSVPAQNIIADVQNGATYDVTFWVKLNSGSQQVTPQIVINSSGGGLQTFAPSSTFCTFGTWTEVTSSITPSWSGNLLHASVRVGTQTSSDFWIDDAVLQPQGGVTQTKMQISPGSWRREPGV